ncbi:uncharacterized protein [Musca autumnalis]|uniref:uncharacterized protein n=1 Tax=Musca autumnalis TaxID=221902 RepID=UPI003CE9346F
MENLQVENTATSRENDDLFNAIKNKFAAKTTNEAASFSPPKFTIPTLKIASGKVDQTSSGSGSPLNDFLLKQLQDKGAKQNGFVLPDLQPNNAFGNANNIFEIPLLKTSNNNTSGLSSLTSAINNLQVNETSSSIELPSIPCTTTPAPANTPAIDLSTALARNTSQHQGTPPTRVFQSKHKQRQQKQSIGELDFEIPFIDCDRLDSTTKVLISAPANEYCQIDISQVPLKPSCVQQPSAVGSFLCLVDKHYVPSPAKYYMTTTMSDCYTKAVKHTIKPFDFNTKSPDDLVLAALEKYQRRHFH